MRRIIKIITGTCNRNIYLANARKRSLSMEQATGARTIRETIPFPLALPLVRGSALTVDIAKAQPKLMFNLGKRQSQTRTHVKTLKEFEVTFVVSTFFKKQNISKNATFIIWRKNVLSSTTCRYSLSLRNGYC